MTEFVNFNLNLDKVQILGYMNTSSKELEWYSWDGFECYDDFSKTNMVGEVANTEDEVKYLYHPSGHEVVSLCSVDLHFTND